MCLRACVRTWECERLGVYKLTGRTSIDSTVESNKVLNTSHCGMVRNLRERKKLFSKF